MSDLSKIVYVRPGTYHITTMLEQKDEIDRLAARIEELEAIVAKLTKTADGVTIVPGMTVWSEVGVRPDNKAVPFYDWPWKVVSWVVKEFEEVPLLNPDEPERAYDEPVDELYSTQAAAEAARTEGGAK